MRRYRIHYYVQQAISYLPKLYLLTDVILSVFLIQFLIISEIETICEKIWLFGVILLVIEFFFNLKDQWISFWNFCHGENSIWVCLSCCKSTIQFVWFIFFIMYIHDCKNRNLDNFFMNFLVLFVFIRVGVYLFLLLIMTVIVRILQTQNGATQEQIESIPSYRFGDRYPNILSSGDHNFCAICYDDYQDDTNVKKLACHHTFCSVCINRWLAIEFNCPLCRRNAETGESDEKNI